MLKEVVQAGKTVEAAIEAACEQLGCPREECQWEIIDLPKKSLFGLKSTMAKVKVTIEVPDAEKPEIKHAPAPQRQAVQEPPKAAPQHVNEEVKPENPETPRVSEVSPENSGKVRIAEDYLQGILQEMGLTAKLESVQEDNGITINMEGQGLGMVIGRRGETLDALQYLTGLVANRNEGDYLRVTLDCGDYRTKRKSTLESLASKLAAQVLKTNISKTLEPMNPFERRIIHATVSEIEGVSSTSIGDEPNRRVVITSPTARMRPPRQGSGRDRRDGDSRPPRIGGGNRGEHRGGSGRDRDHGDRRGPRPQRSAPSQQTRPQGPPKQTPESTVSGDASLYSKIDLE